MSDKKRKASSQPTPERPAKKPQIGGTVKVKHIPSTAVAKPVIATCPGASLPSDLAFQTYAAQTKTNPEILLHSSDHATIDFTARETRTTNSMEAYTKNYVAVFDHSTNQLTVTEAKKMAVRTTVRQPEIERDLDSDLEANIKAKYASRAALTEAFGTKKSRKAMQAIQENRLLARGDSSNPLSEAIRRTVNVDDSEDMPPPSPTDMQANKPLPPANLSTNDIREVYSLSRLVLPSGLNTLSSINTTKWESYQARVPPKPVASSSHFVVNRVGPLLHYHSALSNTGEANPDPSPLEQVKTHLRLLRYLEFLILLHKHLATFPTRKRLPRLEREDASLQELTSIIPFNALLAHMTHFLPDNTPSTFNMTLFRATILALALHIPPAGRAPDNSTLVCEPTDILRDLGRDADEVHKLFRELGCKMAPLGEAETKAWGLERLRIAGGGDAAAKKMAAASNKVKFAKLRFPIEFVKVSQGRQQKKR